MRALSRDHHGEATKGNMRNGKSKGINDVYIHIKPHILEATLYPFNLVVKPH